MKGDSSNMTTFDHEPHVQMTKRDATTHRPSILCGWLKSAVAQVLVLALIISSMPAPAEAKYVDRSGELPGLVSNGVIIAIAAAGGAAIVLLIYLGKRKGPPPVKLEALPVKFSEFTPGQQTKQVVPVTNIMNDPVTVKAVTVEDKSGAFAISDARQVPFTLAPGERFEIPVALTAKNNGGKARLRIVATTAKLKKDSVKTIEISYGQNRSRLGRLIPGK